MSRAERAAPLAAGLLLALPVALAPLPPMLDLPLHEGSVAILRHFGDAARFPPGLYVMNLGHPNQLFHLVAWALSYVVPVTVACKLVAALAVLAIPLAAARLADHVGSTRWSAVVASPIALGWMFVAGLVANLIGLAALVASLPALDRFVAKPTARGALWAALTCVLLYFAHEAMLFVWCGALLALAVLQRPSPRATAIRLAPFAFAAAITVAQLRWQATLLTASEKAHASSQGSLVAKLAEIPETLFAPFDLAAARGVFAVVALAAIALAWPRARVPRVEGDWRARLGAIRFELLALGLFGAYLVFPVAMNGATLVNARFLVPAFVLAVVAAPRGAPVPRLAPLLASIAPIAIALVTWPTFVESSRAYADVARLAPRVAPGSALAVVELTPDDRAPEILHQPVAMFVLVERGGRQMYTFAESPIAPVRIARAAQWDEPLERMWVRHDGMCPSYDLTRFRYVMAYVPSAALQIAAADAFAPDARAVARAGDWVLFESAHAVVPITSPDGPGPGPACAGGRLIDRVRRAQSELRARLDRGEPPPPLPPE